MILKRVGLLASLLGLMLVLSLAFDSTSATGSHSSTVQAPSQLAAAPSGGSVDTPVAPVAAPTPPSSFPKYDKAAADRMCPKSSTAACYFTGNKNKYVCDNPNRSKCDNATAAPKGTTGQATPSQASQTAAAALAQAQCKSPEKSKENLSTKECHANGPDGKQITKGHCVAYNNCAAQEILVEGVWKPATTEVAGPNTGQSGGTPPPRTLPGAGGTPAAPTEPAKPVPTAPAPARPEIDNAYKPTTPAIPPGGAPTPTAPSGGGGSAGNGGAPVGSGTSGNPIQLPTGQQPAVLTPANPPTNPTAPFTTQPHTIHTLKD